MLKIKNIQSNMKTTPQVQLMSKGRTLKNLIVAAFTNRYRYLNTDVVQAACLSHNSKQHGILLIIIMILGGLTLSSCAVCCFPYAGNTFAAVNSYCLVKALRKAMSAISTCHNCMQCHD